MKRAGWCWSPSRPIWAWSCGVSTVPTRAGRTPPHIDRIANPGGRFGAWLADLLLYLLGLSAWWLVLFLLFAVAWGYRRLNGLIHADRRPFFFALAGFLILLLASSGIESLRFWSAGERRCRCRPAAWSAVKLGALLRSTSASPAAH